MKTTTRLSSLTTALCTSALLVGCGGYQGEGADGDISVAAPVGSTSAALTVDPALKTEDAALRWRWIGRKKYPNQACPTPASGPFSTRHLFSPNDDVDVAANSLPPALRSFCLYQVSPSTSVGGGVPASLAALLTPSQNNYLLELEADRMAVAPAAGGRVDIGTKLEGVYKDQLDEHSGRFTALPIKSGGGSISASEQPRLAIIDTAATFEPAANPTSQRSKSPHGYGIANLAEGTVCDDTGNCTSRISTQLAMPLLVTNNGLRVNMNRGGFFGTIGFLAEAVRREVVAWENEKTTPAMSNSHLIVNLSLAWMPEYGGAGPLASWPLDVRAAFWSIADAHCRGALILAAAGNDSNGPSGDTGPSYPGGWESIPAPTVAMCTAALGGAPAASLSTAATSYKPLVYAVSGIDYKGDDLGNAREGGRARISAFGDHAVTLNPANKSTRALTGSSVGTVLVASAAGTVWFYQPDLSPYDVMDVIYGSGDALANNADFCASSGGAACGGASKRVTSCAAAAAACALVPAGPRCTTTAPPCPAWDPSAIDTSAIDFGSFDVLAGDFAFSYEAAKASDPVCASVDLAIDQTSGDVSECPDQQFYGGATKPWTMPQPEIDPCPNCMGFLGSDSLRLSNPSDFSSYSSSTLSVTTAYGTTNYSLSGLSGTDANVTLDAGALSGATSATFTGVYGGASQTSSLYLGF